MNGWDPADFFTSEEANARLMDELLKRGKHLMFVAQRVGEVLLWVDHTKHYLGERKEVVLKAFCETIAGIEVGDGH